VLSATISNKIIPPTTLTIYSSACPMTLPNHHNEKKDHITIKAKVKSPLDNLKSAIGSNLKSLLKCIKATYLLNCTSTLTHQEGKVQLSVQVACHLEIHQITGIIEVDQETVMMRNSIMENKIKLFKKDHFSPILSKKSSMKKSKEKEAPIIRNITIKKKDRIISTKKIPFYHQINKI
jgi:hypothetical protein